MNHNRHSRAFFACLLLIICGLSAESRGQLSPAAFNTPSQALIDPFVKKQVELLSGDPERWAGARSLLTAEASHQNSSATFFDIYATSLNQFLLPLTKNSDVRIRLNAAIVAARVAARANNADLAPVVLALLKDSSEAVVLWGLQAAKYVLPAQLIGADNKNADVLAKETIDAAKNHVDSPAIAEEAYRALLLDPLLPGVSPVNYVNSINPGVLQKFLPNTMALFEFRIGLYNDGDPKQPLADTWCSSFLATGKGWGAQTKDQQAQTLHLMLDLLKGAAKQNTATPSPEMLDVIKRTGQAFEVACRPMGKPAVMTAAHAVTTLTPTAAQTDIDTAIANLASLLSPQ